MVPWRHKEPDYNFRDSAPGRTLVKLTKKNIFNVEEIFFSGFWEKWPQYLDSSADAVAFTEICAWHRHGLESRGRAQAR